MNPDPEIEQQQNDSPAIALLSFNHPLSNPQQTFNSPSLVRAHHPRASSLSTNEVERIVNEEIDKYFKEKNDYMKDKGRSFRTLILFCINCFIFMLARELPFGLHQLCRINQTILSYYDMIKYELIYWVPNMFFPLIFGFICDYASSDLIGVRLLILTMIVPMFLSELIIVISDRDEHDLGIKIVSRFLFSFSGETFFIMLISSLSVWFKNNDQIEKICWFVFVESIALALSNLIIGIAPYYFDINDNDGTAFLVITRIFLILLFLLLIYNYFFYPKGFEKNENKLFDEIRNKYTKITINKQISLKDSIASEFPRMERKDSISHDKYGQSADFSLLEKKSFVRKVLKEDILPSSLWDVLINKLLNFRLILLSLIHAIVVVCYFLFENLVMCFLFINYRTWNGSQDPQESPISDPYIYSHVAFANFGIQSIKAMITLLVPQFLKKTGNRNLLLYISVVAFIFAFAISSIYFDTTQKIIIHHNISNSTIIPDFVGPMRMMQNGTEIIKNEDFDQNLNYFIICIVLSAVCLGYSFQQTSFFSYIPVLVEEKFYMTTYGFFSCIQSIFIVVFYCIIEERIIQSDHLQLEDMTNILGVLLLILIISLVLIMILEYGDQKGDRKLYEKEAKKNILEEKKLIPRIFQKRTLS